MVAPFFVVYFVGDAVALSIFGSMLNIRTIIFNCIQTHYEMCDSMRLHVRIASVRQSCVSRKSFSYLLLQKLPS